MPAPAPATDADRTAGLDGLRALAALSVLAFHVWLYRTNRPHGARPAVLDKAMFELNTGLVLFFVLSGYLLYGAFVRAALTAGPRVALRRYALRRAGRIVPAYYVSGALCLVLFAVVGYDGLMPDLRLLPVYAAFGQNYSSATIAQVNPVAWTLCVEVAFYALLPVLGAVAAVLGRRVWAQVGFLLAIIAASSWWSVVVWRHGSPALYRQALPEYLGVFAIGMLVAVWRQSRQLRGAPSLGALATSGLVLGGFGLVLANGYWHETRPIATTFRIAAGVLTTGAGFALLVAAVTGGAPRSRAVRWLAWRPLAAVGVVSYGLYLWHLPLLLIVRQLGLLPHDLLPRLLVVAAAGLIAAAASWRWVERPCLERVHARSGRLARSRPEAQVQPG